jgi:ribokinase/sulfofructose kinase
VAVDHGGFAEHQAFGGPVVDTTGAGDTFNAAFLAAALEGQNLQSAVRFGCAAASCTLAAVGARGNLPDRQTVAAIIASAAAPR